MRSGKYARSLRKWFQGQSPAERFIAFLVSLDVGPKERPRIFEKAVTPGECVLRFSGGFCRIPVVLIGCWPLKSRQGDRRDRRQHPGFHLQIILLALARHFFLMRFEIVYALSDFVAL